MGRLVVRPASLPLPSEHRWRYRQEFLAELYGMTPAEQRHHAIGILSRVWTLWVALTSRNGSAQEATMAKPWLCRIRSTVGSGCTTPKTAGTANAAGVESNSCPATGDRSRPRTWGDLMRLVHRCPVICIGSYRCDDPSRYSPRSW